LKMNHEYNIYAYTADEFGEAAIWMWC